MRFGAFYGAFRRRAIAHQFITWA